MANDRDGHPSGDSDDAGRTARDREKPVNPWLPSYSEARSVLLQIGVDISSENSVTDFNSAIEWAKLSRDKAKERAEYRRRIIAGGIVAFLGGIATWFVQWVILHVTGGTKL